MIAETKMWIVSIEDVEYDNETETEKFKIIYRVFTSEEEAEDYRQHESHNHRYPLYSYIQEVTIAQALEFILNKIGRQ